MLFQEDVRVECKDNMAIVWKMGLCFALVSILGAIISTTYSGWDEPGAPKFASGPDKEFLGKQCIFAVEDVEEAIARAENASIPGSVVNVTDLLAGRLGNHFATAYRFLALGYCCKSKLVTLPPKDPMLAPEIFGMGTAGPRHFDFSEAPDVPGFDSNTCRDKYTIGGDNAYRAYLRTQGDPSGRSHDEPLTACIEKSRVLECEAAYYFPTNVDICSDSHPVQESAGANVSVATGAGHLVIHVRSGDIFRRHVAYGNYGQPPLGYYSAILNSREWQRVDILTHARSKRHQNPVLPALQAMINKDSWSKTNIHVFTKRNIEVDLWAMLCADALATSTSTLGGLTMYHTRARTVYLPSTCDGPGGGFGLTPKRLVDARAEEENFEVIGVILNPDAPPYHVYDFPEDKDKYDSSRQRHDMLTYEGIAGLVVCS